MSYKIFTGACLLAAGSFLFGCNIKGDTSTSTTTSKASEVKKEEPALPPPPRQAPQPYTYSMRATKAYLTSGDSNITKSAKEILMAVNRADASNLKRLDSILVPDNYSGDRAFYLPFPLQSAALKEIEKIILFSYSTQSFAAYAWGELVISGPTSMGSKKHPTPVGLYFSNWKAEETISTFNDEWELKWNFNIENKEGIGFHQYELPGYPASHSCLRLLEDDAKFMYTWTEQWEIKGTDDIKAKGTPVIVFGVYPFGSKRPWFKLLTDPNALNLTEAELAAVINPFKLQIATERTKRNQHLGRPEATTGE